MASKYNDDMPVKTSYVVIPPEDTSFWPEIDAGESCSGFSTPWKQAINDVIKYLDIEEPYSAEADKDGIHLAEFLIENADLSIAMKEIEEQADKGEWGGRSASKVLQELGGNATGDGSVCTSYLHT